MFSTMGIPILAEPIDVLHELQSQLALNGIRRFGRFVPTNTHIQFCCPFHNDGQESNPSCGITTEDIKYSDGRTVSAGTVHCFACGYVSSLEVMISRLFGKEDGGIFGSNWLRKNFLTIEYEERPELDLDMDRHKKKSNQSKQEQKFISEEELDSYRYFHPYMYKRKLTDDVIELFDVGYDKDFELKSSKTGNVTHYRCITFPVRDEYGNTLFIARRSVDTKFFHYPQGVQKPVYGLYELKQLPEFPQDIIICESIINCLTCYVYGRPAVALNGTGTPFQYEQLRKLPCRHYILGLDPDSAGDKGRAKLQAALGNDKIITQLILPRDKKTNKGKDINDLTREEFENLEEIF